MEDLKKPILPGKGASDYERYLRTDELLSLQKPPAEMLHPDELTFQVTHQSSELLLKAVAWERSEEHTSELQSLSRISYAVFCRESSSSVRR